MKRLLETISRGVGIALRVVLACAGLLLFGVLLACGAVLALLVFTLARLSGRRTAGLHFAWRGPLGSAARHWRGAATPSGRAPGRSGDIIDAEVREVAPVDRPSPQRLGER